MKEGLKECDIVSSILFRFTTEIEPFEVGCFRGAIAGALGWDHELLHNHVGEKLAYRYPLVQYKSIGGIAYLLCLGDATDYKRSLLSIDGKRVDIGRRRVSLELDEMLRGSCSLGIVNSRMLYRVDRWVALNEVNFKRFSSLGDLAEQLDMLKSILVGNILSMAKGLGIHIEGRIECSILEIDEPQFVIHKGVRLISFDMVISTNVVVPNYIGLGKAVSHGFGVVSPLK